MSKIITSTLEKITAPEKRSIISGPFGSNISSKFFVESGVPVIRGNNLTIGHEKFIDSGFVFVTKEKAEELNCYAYYNDLIFTAAGTLGQVGIIPQNATFDEYVISNKQIRVRLNTDIIDVMYAFYWFSSPWITQKLSNSNKGSTVPLLTLAEIRELPITYPESLDEQRRIVKMLDSLSDKIANNHRINNNLEAQARTIYDYWFSQFDFPNVDGKPYRSSGGRIIWNEQLKRYIPYGWSVVSLADLMVKNSTPFDYSSNKPTIDLSVMPSDSISLFNSLVSVVELLTVALIASL